MFDVAANEQGRIAEEVDLSQGARSDQYELVFHASEYYASNASSDSGYQIMQTVVLRLDLPDASGNYHLPIMLSPHAYSVWWSGAPPENN